jgi:hypothetical protein
MKPICSSKWVGSSKFAWASGPYINSLIFDAKIVSNLGSKIVEISICYGDDQEEEKQHKSFKSTTQMERLAKRMTCGRHVKPCVVVMVHVTCAVGDVKGGG